MATINTSPDSFSLTSPSPPSSLILNSASHFITLKLIIDNYPLWKAQIVLFLKGNQLFGFIGGTVSPSPPSNPDGTVNPKYMCWLLQDQFIISTINSSLTWLKFDCATSREVWQTLQTLYFAQSVAHAIQTQFQLATLKKDLESISTYFHKAQMLASSLGAMGSLFSSSQFSIYLLAGLGPEYESIVTFITTRPEPLSSQQIYSYLLNHESRLAHQNASLISSTSLAAYATNVRPSHPSGFSSRG